MYKVFINDKPIIFTTSLKKEENYLVYFFKDIDLKELINKLKKESYEGVFLLCDDLEYSWNFFLSSFTVKVAAGGLVVNSLDQVLFIFRENKWDLPKGHIEKNESSEEAAIREVEEECGIFNLTIDRFLLETYHLFYRSGEFRIKKTFWYLMYSDFSGNLIPQLEEGITKVEFVNQNNVFELFDNTYANIKLVYHKFIGT